MSSKKKINPVAEAAKKRLQQVEAERARIKALEDAETERIRKEEEEIAIAKKALEDEKLRKQKEKEDKIAAQKTAGTFKTPAEKRKEKENHEKAKRLQLRQVLEVPKLELVPKLETLESLEALKTIQPILNIRAPITCIMGHVDVGKTSLLDNIRNTNVQEGEVGGITQQIGASFIPIETIQKRTGNHNIQVPGLLMIDTPGHEAFSNLRTRGTKLCDIAFIIVDLMHGIEPQTIESINILKENEIPFIIALNKVDRLFGWSSAPNRMIQESLTENHVCVDEFKNRLDGIILQINQLGINAKLFWENDSLEDTVSICPISAKTGEGVGDLLELLAITSQPVFEEELKCIVMEKALQPGFGTVIDVIVINGSLKKNDKIIISTSDGPIETVIKNLLTPPPNRESRVKSEYIHNESVKGALGVKLIAHNLNDIIVGSQIYLSNTLKESEIPDISEIPVSTSFNLVEEGVSIHASTQGSLEALYAFLQQNSVPISEVIIGDVKNKHVSKILKPKKEHNVILAFNVDIEKGITIQNKEKEITIFSDETIYRLYEQYIKFRDEIIRIRKEEASEFMVFPCKLQILPKHIYNKTGPIVFGVKVLEGSLHFGTKLCVPSLNLTIGKVIGIQHNSKDITIAKKDMEVCIKVENIETTIIYGRHFDDKNILCSEINRKSIDVLKEYFREEITKEDLQLLIQLKKELKVN
jgi:translation initiation factor 5B